MIFLYAWCSLYSLFSIIVSAADTSPPSTFPHVYPGQPKGDYSPAWQMYFEVTEPLPNVTFSLPGRSYAGNVAVQRSGHPNNTLFFYGFEKSYGSLTAPASENNTDPWGIWLNGGPGSSSMYGLLFENGPIRVNSDYSVTQNPYSWTNVADYVWVDQPVGVGFSTADANGYVADEDQLGVDFMGFLGNLVKVFPSLATRPLHLTGESYSGMYIPYILKTYFGMANPPVNISKIAIGDGSIGSEQQFEFLPSLSVIETHPQLIGYDPVVFNYFKSQHHLCNYDINLTYPQNGIIPSIEIVNSSQREIPFFSKSSRKTFFKELTRRSESIDPAITVEERTVAKEIWKRDVITQNPNTLNSWYGCFLFDEMLDYALNFSFPWSLNVASGTFDYYDVTDALNPEVNRDGSVFMNDPRSRAALHAPTSSNWTEEFDFSFGLSEDPSPEAMIMFSELATNATARNVSVVLYSANDDSLIPHFGTEIVIQNTTFGGIQGFTRRPSTPWTNDAGEFAGIVHQERNWTYALFYGAGHLIPEGQPISALTFVREFIFGTNTTGLVTTSSNNQATVAGGENSTLAEPILRGGDEIYYGSATTMSTYIAPSATRAAWDAFIETATSTPISAKFGNTNTNAGVARYRPLNKIWQIWWIAGGGIVWMMR